MSRLRETEHRFSRSGSANTWNHMYSTERPRSLFEQNIRERRDYTVRYLTRHVGRDARILDLGCGTGPVVSELRKAGLTCIGVDRSQDMLDFAVTRLRSMGLDDSGLQRCDCRKTPFADASFDAIVCLGVISHVEDYDQVLTEIRRLLRPGGVLIISFRNKFNPILSDAVACAKFAVKELTGRRQAEDVQMGRYLDYREVTRKIAAKGFAVQDFQGFGLGPFRLNGRKVLGEEHSIKLSCSLTRLLATARMKALTKWLADVSIWVCLRAESAMFDRGLRLPGIL